MQDNHKSMELIGFVSEIVAGYVSNHTVRPEDVPGLISLVYQSLVHLNKRPCSPLAFPSKPAVSIEDSIKPDFLVCLEDGSKLKMLKRHLKSAYKLIPQQYRQRWGLPDNYPMTAPSYSKKKQNIAKEIELGTHRKMNKKKAA